MTCPKLMSCHTFSLDQSNAHTHITMQTKNKKLPEGISCLYCCVCTIGTFRRIYQAKERHSSFIIPLTKKKKVGINWGSDKSSSIDIHSPPLSNKRPNKNITAFSKLSWQFLLLRRRRRHQHWAIRRCYLLVIRRRRQIIEIFAYIKH